ncbi:MAG: hypothetical protein IPH07_13010 [Deltaproteobacteria bacterium]|nr:hypothetical protein [Deltaproteobacteria bacterium]MBK8717008.1 hypothetical protein [Deltaproteobacteria bacterium]
MIKNFVVGQSNELLMDGRVHEIHNFYRFGGLNIGPDRFIVISFVPCEPNTMDFPRLKLECRDVDYFELSSQFGCKDVREVDEMGYKSPGDLDDEWLMTEQQASAADHFFLRLEHCAYIRVHGRYMRLVIVAPQP